VLVEVIAIEAEFEAMSLRRVSCPHEMWVWFVLAVAVWALTVPYVPLIALSFETAMFGTYRTFDLLRPTPVEEAIAAFYHGLGVL
jgi:hypothetical protein